MEFALSADQTLAADSIRSALERAVPLDVVRAAASLPPGDFSRDVWNTVVDLGLPAILVPEEHGGLGLGLLDAALASEQLGRILAPSPFVGAAVMAPLALRLAGSPAQQSEWLPKIASGEVSVAVALQEHAGGAREGAGLTWADGKLTGTTQFALDAPWADLIIVADRERRLFLVDAKATGLTSTAQNTIDRTRPARKLTLDGVFAEPLPNSGAEALAAIIDAGRIALAADTLGAAQVMIEKSVAYAQERRQFGRVIGSFQAVKHLCAEMAAELEPCRALLWYAGYAHEGAPDAFALHARQAKAHLSEVGTFVARTATEVHGGMGFTDLLGLHFWFKRIGFNRQVLGGPERLRHEAAVLQGWIAA